MPLKGHILNQVIKYLSSKLAENYSFQRLSLTTHQKLEAMRREALEQVVNPDLARNYVNRIIHRWIENGKIFLKGK